MAQYAVLLDACVLYPFGLRDLLVQLATTGIFRARWTNQIHSEWMGNLVKKGLPIEQLESIRDLMEQAIPDAQITGHDPLIGSIKKQKLPDEKDAHVIAAAIRGNVDMIVTWNIKDFPEELLAPYHIEVQEPDDFLLNQFGLDAAKVLQSVKACRMRLTDPELTPIEYLKMLERNKLTNTALELRSYAEAFLI